MPFLIFLAPFKFDLLKTGENYYKKFGWQILLGYFHPVFAEKRTDPYAARKTFSATGLNEAFATRGIVDFFVHRWGWSSTPAVTTPAFGPSSSSEFHAKVGRHG